MTSSVTIDGTLLTVLVAIVLIGSVYLAGRVAARRGRSFRAWAWISALLMGPLAVPLLLLLPDLTKRGG